MKASMPKTEIDSTFISDFNALIQQNSFKHDTTQLQLVEALNDYKLYLESLHQKAGLITKIKNIFTDSDALNSLKKGIYIWGDVGGGKSMITTFFYEKLDIESKTRQHFHDFMLSVHALLNAKREQNHKDPFTAICEEISKNKVIVLDEIFVNNVADAMILERLLKTLIEMGVFVIFTSNREPKDLYLDGLQRERFKPFIELVEKDMLVYKLSNLEDYRMSAIKNLDTSYFYPIGTESNQFINDAIKSLTGHEVLSEAEIETSSGRMLKVINSYGHIAYFTFNELCGVPMGASDYLALTHHFKVILISDVPVFTEENREEAMRFITLVDCLYDTKTQLICTAQDAPNKLYKGGRIGFEFQRTVSRLNEMQSLQYLNDNGNSYQIECSD